MSKMLPLYGFASGNASLNFRILAYDTKEELLTARPAENTIGIVTETKITSYAFSSVAPSEPDPGMLWIMVGMFSPGAFNALKKNAIQICPLCAKQYVSGAWVDVVAINYLGGKWVEWTMDIIIYDSGATDITLDMTEAKDSGTYLTLTLGTNGSASVKSELVNLSGQKQLEVVYSNLGGGSSGTTAFAGGVRARVWDENGNTAIQTEPRSTSSSGTLKLDISGLTAGRYMVGVYANNSSASYSGSCRVQSIKVLMDTETAATE